jgi:diguanylate cyclase (GGDEF)-like protein
MTEDVSVERIERPSPKLAFSRSNILRILVWPILCLLLAMALWYWTAAKINADKVALEQKALEEVGLMSRDYEQYLNQVIEQANQITLQLKYNWEQSHGRLNLHEMMQGGIFRNPQIISVLVIDREGIPVASSNPRMWKLSLADRDYFLFHKDDPSTALLLGKPMMGRLAGRPLITFSRRLNTRDGRFDGVALVSFEPEYLTSFYAGAFPGQTGLLAVAGLDGSLRSVKIGHEPQKQTAAPLRAVPLFDTPEGASSLSGEQWFDDKLERVVAWKTLKDYPLVAMAGISKREYFAPYQQTWSTYKLLAILGSVVLVLFGIVAAGMSVRLAMKKHQEEAVKKTYRLATEGGSDGFYMYEALRDKKGAIVDFVLVDCNERGAQLYGLSSASAILGTKLSSRYSRSYFDQLMRLFCSAMESGFYEDELRVPAESQLQAEWVKRRLVRFGNGLAATVQDISSSKLAEEKIEFLAHHDPLTHLPNRVLLRDRCEQAMAIAKREDSGVIVMFLDLDHFKNINDSFGHLIGDQLLIQVVKRLQDCIRDADTICRLGGDEFIIVLPNLADLNDISRIAQSILDAFSEPFVVNQQTLHTSASIGISLFPNDGVDFDTLLKNADTAMYQAKEGGRNTYSYFTAKMNADALDRLNLHTQLRTALQKKEFELHYQPQIDLITGKVVGMEALIRWQHPEQGLVSPARFIPVAETSGLIIPIGKWVLEEACKQARIWQQDGRAPFMVAVNLSALQFKRGNILDTVRKTLENSGLPPSMLELELTESILLKDMSTALKTIQDLKALGVQLSIDDFGTGYSSLSYLRQLKVDKLKIDQSFVSNIVAEVDDLAIVCAIIQLGKTLQMEVIAEGVETIEQLDMLRARGCDEAQGYYICRPLAVAGIDDWLDARN